MVDWSGLEHDIGGQVTAEAGLKNAKLELEKFLAPHVTETETDSALRFKGKKRYLKHSAPDAVFKAMMTLQFLYNLLDAKEAGDIDRVIRMSIGYAKESAEVINLKLWGADSVSALAAGVRQKNARTKGRNRANENRVAKYEPVRADAIKRMHDLVCVGKLRPTDAAKRVRDDLAHYESQPSVQFSFGRRTTGKTAHRAKVVRIISKLCARR